MAITIRDAESEMRMVRRNGGMEGRRGGFGSFFFEHSFEVRVAI